MKSTIKPLEIPLASGCAQQASEYASPPVPRTVTNLRLLQRGGLGKRPGARGLAGTTSSTYRKLSIDGTNGFVESPSCVSKVGNSPFIGISSGEAFVMDENQGTLFEACGAFSSAVPVRKRRAFASVVGIPTGSKPGAVAVSSAGYVLIATIFGTTCLAAIETPDGARIYQININSVTEVRCHAVGTKLFLVWQDGSSIKLRAYVPSATNEGQTNAATVATLATSSYKWDTSSYDGTHWFLLHGDTVNTLTITKFANTTSAGTASFGTWLGVTDCSIWADSTAAQVWVGYYDDPSITGNVNFRVYAASNLASVKGETTLNSGTTYGPPVFGQLRHRTTKSDQNTGAFYAYRYVVDTALGVYLRATYYGNAWSDGTAASTGDVVHGVLPISKPDSRHRIWCMVDNGSTEFAVARIALLRFHDEMIDPPVVELTLPSMIAPGTSVGPSARLNYFHAIATGSTTAIAVMPRVLTVLDGTPFLTVEVIEYSPAELSSWRSVSRSSPSTAVSGSPVEFYGFSFGKGEIVSTGNTEIPYAAGASEMGFLNGPTIVAGSLIGGSGGPTGSYVWRAVYEWDDTYGRRHRSEPSPPFEFTLTGTSGVRLTVTTLDVSQRRSNGTTQNAVRVLLYRTLAGGTTYQRVYPSDAFGSGYVVLDDTDPDSDLADEEFIYTDGGVLENNLAPSCRYLARSEDRLWFGGLFTPGIIQCSKIIIPEEPIQCTDHPSHQVVLPGECTGLAYMDGQIAAFTRDSILLINSSSGPNDQGVGEFAPPRLHTSGLGCVDGRSVLETPEGIFFLSQRGIELLPRGFGTVQFIGEAIKDLQQTSLLDQCGFSAYQADKNGSYARFGLMTGSSEFSVPSVRYVATYDLNTAQWFIDDYGSETMGAMGAWPNGFALVRTDLDSDTSPTPIWYEDGSLVSQPETSGAAYIDSSIVVNRLWPFGHAGWGKVRRVLVTFYSHVANWTLSLTVQTDENTAQTVTWSVTGTGLQWRQLSVVNDECSSIKITISDTDLSSNGAKQAATYLMCALESEAHDGLRLLASGDRQ